MITFYSSLETFVEMLFSTLYSLRNERDHKAATNFNKRKIHRFAKGSPEEKYSQSLTGYAANFVMKQIEPSKNINVNVEHLVDDNCVLHTNEGDIHVYINKCECGFFHAMRLPSRHVLAFRCVKGLTVYDENLCDTHWTMNYFNQHQRNISKSSDHN